MDNHALLHPLGLTASGVMGGLLEQNIDLFLCSFNPTSTSKTEKELSKTYLDHIDNTEQREITIIPMVPPQDIVSTEITGRCGQHIIFVLDESGSMANDWSGVVAAYNQFITRRCENQRESDLVSVVQFSNTAEVTVRMRPIVRVPNDLKYRSGGTQFYPAALSACQLADETPRSHVPIIMFMSDGQANDAAQAASEFSQLTGRIHRTYDTNLELHVISFGGQASTSQLSQITGSSKNGKLHTSANTVELSNIFVDIAGAANVANLLEAEIGNRISEAVTDRLSLEYMG